tara:strand:- start:232 stop:483 length:252 start_codon:yes stop_codon:yes gene_type:complete
MPKGVKVKVVVKVVLARDRARVVVNRVAVLRVVVARVVVARVVVARVVVLVALVAAVALLCWDYAKMHLCKKKSIWLMNKKLT